MDILLDLLMTLARALINQSVALLLSKLQHKKSKEKTTRIARQRSRWSSKD